MLDWMYSLIYTFHRPLAGEMPLFNVHLNIYTHCCFYIHTLLFLCQHITLHGSKIPYINLLPVYTLIYTSLFPVDIQSHHVQLNMHMLCGNNAVLDV